MNYFDWMGLTSGEVNDFAVQWLQSGATEADFAPSGGDGVFDLQEFAQMHQEWMTNQNPPVE